MIDQSQPSSYQKSSNSGNSLRDKELSQSDPKESLHIEERMVSISKGDIESVVVQYDEDENRPESNHHENQLRSIDVDELLNSVFSEDYGPDIKSLASEGKDSSELVTEGLKDSKDIMQISKQS